MPAAKADTETLFFLFLGAALLALINREQATSETVIPRDEALLTDWVEGE